MRTTLYLHGDKDSYFAKGEDLGLTGEALRQFCYACYEVKVTVEVDPETGNTSIVAVDDRPLEEIKT